MVLGFSIVVEEKICLFFDDGDVECFLYYVFKVKFIDVMVNGIFVVVLCGKVWVFFCNFEKFFVCLECKEIFDLMNW